MPIGKPRPSATSIDSVASSKVTGSFSASILPIGSRVRTEVPKSPCTRLLNQAAYCTGTGSLKRYFWRIYSTTSGVRSSPASASAGSPGNSFCRPNTSIDTSSRVGSAVPSRRRTRAVMSSPSIHRLDAGQAQQAVGHHDDAADRFARGEKPVRMVQRDRRQRGEIDVGRLGVERLALGLVCLAAGLRPDRVELLVAGLAGSLRGAPP